MNKSNAIKQIEALRTCMVSGHIWGCKANDVFCDYYSKIIFECSRCGAKIVKILRSKNQRKYARIMHKIFNQKG